MNRELEELVENAKQWNALPLLFHILGNDNIPIPQSLRSLSRTQYIQNYLAAVLFLRELREVLSSLADRGVEVIVLKGAALTMNVYPSLGVRPMRDIDLLIHREDLAQVVEILRALGYQRYPPPARNGIEKFQGEVTWVKTGQFPMVIEPHWTLGPEYPYSGRIEAQDLWHRARRVNLDGIDTLILCPEDSLLHTCLHLFHHGQGFWLVPACDITGLIRHYESNFDWKAFLNRVIEFNLCLPVQYSLKKTYKVLHPPIPSSIFEGLSLYKPSRFESKLYALLSRSSNPIGPGNLIKLLTVPGIVQKLRYLCSVLLPSKEWLMTYYSNSAPKSLGLYALHVKNIFLTGPKVLLRFLFVGK